MKSLNEKIETEFQRRFDSDYILINAPGRVNLIGEHTDYNDGFVLPAAIDKSIVIAMAPNYSGKLRFYAVDKEDSFETELTPELSKSGKEWPDYLLGVADQLQKRGYEIDGFDCVFGGNVPIGAGMSSSAALESGVLFGLSELYDLDISNVEMAKIAQKAENDFVGVQCGIMDQFVSLNSQKNHVMKLDCRSLAYAFYPFTRDDIKIVLCDTQVRRQLATSEYNVRRSQCEQGVETLQKYDSEIKSLRDVSIDFLKKHESDLDPTVYKRCKFVVEENKRVLDACHALQKDTLASFGVLMFASHAGLRDLFEVSCKELNILVQEAQKFDGVLGARMMGGGFGGCTINLVEGTYLEYFREKISKRYQNETGIEVKIYDTRVSGGTRLVNTSKIANK